jgi:excisionase family DNA binding protein
MARRTVTTLQMASPGARLLTIPEVMATLGVGRTKVYDLIKRGGLPYIHLDGSTRVWETSLRQWIAQRERRNIPA